MRRIAQTFTDDLVERIRGKPTYSIEEAKAEIASFYTFDGEALREQALRRVVLQIARRIRDKDGQRMVYALPSQNKLVNLLECKDKAIWAEIDRLLAKRAKNMTISARRIKRQRKIVQGQISIEELLRTGTNGD